MATWIFKRQKIRRASCCLLLPDKFRILKLATGWRGLPESEGGRLTDLAKFFGCLWPVMAAAATRAMAAKAALRVSLDLDLQVEGGIV